MISESMSFGTRLRRWTIPLTLAIIFGVTFWVFLPALQNDFVSWDDDVYVTTNPRVQKPSLDNLFWFFRHAYFRSYTPLAFASHMLDYEIWRDNPFGHHLVSLLLHSANTGWVFLLALALIGIARSPAVGQPGSVAHLLFSRTDTAAILGAASAALAFGIHPLRAESASWISDRKDLLCAFFLLPSIVSYLAASVAEPARRSRWLLFSALLYLPALLSKSVAALAPLILLVLDLFLLYSGRIRSTWRLILTTKIPFLLLGGAATLAAFLAIPEGGVNLLARDLTSEQKLLLPLYSITFYLGKLVWPFSLAPVYELAGTATMTLYALIAVLVTGLVAVLWRLGLRSVAAAWLTFILLLSPTVLFLSTGVQPIADRYTYLPSIALCLLLGAAIGRGWQLLAGLQSKPAAQSLMLAGLALLFIGWGALAHRQTAAWKDSLALWIQAMKISPGVAAGYNGAGVALGKMGKGDEAIRFFRQAIQLQKKYPVAWTNLGIVLRGQGKTLEAAECFRTSIRLQEDFADPYVYLGEMAETEGRKDSALIWFRAARAADPASPVPYTRLGTLFAEMAQYDSAAESFSSVIILRPDDDRAYLEMAKSLEAAGEADRARHMLVESARRGNEEARGILARTAQGAH